MKVHILCNNTLNQKLILCNNILQEASISQAKWILSERPQILCEISDKFYCIQSDKSNSFFIAAKMTHLWEDINTTYMGSSCLIKWIIYSYPFSISLLQHPLKSTWSLTLDFNRSVYLWPGGSPSVTAPTLSCSKGLSGTKKIKKIPCSSVNEFFDNPQPLQSMVKHLQSWKQWGHQHFCLCVLLQICVYFLFYSFFYITRIILKVHYKSENYPSFS